MLRNLATLGMLTCVVACDRGCWKPRTADVELVRAAERGEVETIRGFLADGGSPGFSYSVPEGSRFGGSITLLEGAISSGSWELVSLLTPEARYRDQALFYALQQDQRHIAAKLVEVGAHVPPKNARVAVTRIFEHHGHVLENFKLLEASGFEFTAEDFQSVLNRLCLMVSGAGGILEEYRAVGEAEFRSVAEFLMTQKITVSEHPTLVADAIQGKAFSVAMGLIRRGAAVDAPTEDYAMTPLTAAVQAGRPELVSALLAAGADPSRADGFGDTPLELARRQNDSAILDLLQR